MVGSRWIGRDRSSSATVSSATHHMHQRTSQRTLPPHPTINQTRAMAAAAAAEMSGAELAECREQQELEARCG